MVCFQKYTDVFHLLNIVEDEYFCISGKLCFITIIAFGLQDIKMIEISMVDIFLYEWEYFYLQMSKALQNEF